MKKNKKGVVNYAIVLRAARDNSPIIKAVEAAYGNSGLPLLPETKLPTLGYVPPKFRENKTK